MEMRSISKSRAFRACVPIWSARKRSSKDNPDRIEIMADLEQAIADKCAHFLAAAQECTDRRRNRRCSKGNGAGTERRPAVAGTTPGAEPHADAKPSGGTGPAPKRLYQIREGAMLSGVCTGLAAYLNIDVTIVRIGFVLLTLLTTGIWILVYLVMMLVVPFANTGEEHAAAAGAPFNAQEVIDRAKKHYAEFKDSKEWRRHWRQQRREWRRRWRDGAYWWGHNLQRNVHQFSTDRGLRRTFGRDPAHSIPGSLQCPAVLRLDRRDRLARHDRSDLRLGGGGSIPLWVSILLLMFVYSIISRPLRHVRRAIYFNTGGNNYLWFAAWYEILSTGVLILVCWLAYTHVPQVHEFFQHFLQNVTTMWHNIVDSFHSTVSRPPGSGFDARLPAAAAAATTSSFLALRS